MTHARLRRVVVLLTLAASVSASMPLAARQSYRSSIPLPTKWSQGYVRPVSGDVLVYPWAYPGQAEGRRAVRLEISLVSSAADAALKTGAQTLWTGTADPGFTSTLVPAGLNQKASLPLVVEIDGRVAFEETLELTPVRHREVHLLPHSHVDIGYSDPQPVVERKQWKNLRDAVELARKTASYPPEA